MSEPVINGAFLLAGVILGFILSEVATNRRTAQESRRQKYSVHTMVRQEIETNRGRLREWWQGVNPYELDSRYSAKERLIARAQYLVEQPAPQWTRVRWESLSLAIPSALGPSEVRDVGQFHETLEKIAGLHVRVAQMSPDEGDKLRAVRDRKPGSDLFAWAAQFSSDTRLKLWTQLEEDVQSLLDAPNPLPELAVPQSTNPFDLLRRAT